MPSYGLRMLRASRQLNNDRGHKRGKRRKWFLTNVKVRGLNNREARRGEREKEERECEKEQHEERKGDGIDSDDEGSLITRVSDEDQKKNIENEEREDEHEEKKDDGQIGGHEGNNRGREDIDSEVGGGSVGQRSREVAGTVTKFCDAEFCFEGHVSDDSLLDEDYVPPSVSSDAMSEEIPMIVAKSSIAASIV
ncbi:hypothetical protein CAPTEDRAFT_203836 [Capitella teleta]|uniref:Uncharacterized protein n=1 Tax=Capitella teleta TaxID=283909 RepID=R7VIF8_CAPTE|nr:hypothetical protein CAPTEDRAFT_203836 [Capitella teleta]|eukprot:ELU15500.1 hypothetical protein CAPTEDRAFT_203836 [Capitella teleta]